MATYAELLIASENSTLNNKVKVACFISAETVRTESGATSNHANRLLWAKRVFENPDVEGRRMVWAVLAQNQAAVLSAITGATDVQVQNAVNAAIDVFATGA